MRDWAQADPALVAAGDVEQAEQEFLAVQEVVTKDGVSPRFTAAEMRWEKAEECFADAIPTTLEGAVAKLSALRDMHLAFPMSNNSLEVRHVESLMAFIECLGERAHESETQPLELRPCA